MHLAWLASLKHEANGGAQTFANEVMMHSRCCQQSRYRNTVRTDLAVRQDDDVIAARHRRFGAVTKARQRTRHAVCPFAGWIGHIQSLRIKAIFSMADTADFFQILIGQNRLAHFQTLAAGIAFKVKYVRTGADERDKAHHQFFSDRINRRVGDLRKVLLEIGIK